MVSIDTNIIVRFLTHDDQVQYEKSRALFESHDIFIPDTVILETEWVLRYAYDFDAKSICGGLKKLFGLPNVQLSSPPMIGQALDWHAAGLDFADAFHLAQSQELESLYTFDKKFIKGSAGYGNCKVLAP